MMVLEWNVLYPAVVFVSIIHGSRSAASDIASYDKMRPEACRIFCMGKILHYVQMTRVFNDSKYFVDMKLKNSPQETENRFNELLSKTEDNPSKSDLLSFVEENFSEPGTEFELWNPEDWKPLPKFTYEVYDFKLRNWIRELNKKWKVLGRKVSSDVLVNEDLYSQIYVPNPFIVPGGRFTEIYYWDSYWIIEGLLLSEMESTARGMIENFIYLVNEYGYVPNGNRKYYLGRSQPPFLIPMVNIFWKHTRDLNFLRQTIDVLEKEFQFWNNNRSTMVTVDGTVYKVFQYKVTSSTPRPESYYEDENLAQSLKNETEKSKLFSEIKSGAESGWDFSSRWFISKGEHTTNMSNINVLSIAPVCLNSLMAFNANLLSNFFGALGNPVKQNEYRELAVAINSTISRIFWSERDGVWLDYNLETKELIPGFYPSNLMPLWTESFGQERDRSFVVNQVLAYLERNKIQSYHGGIPASLVESGQQWDYPNGWAPLQYFIVMGLHKAGRYNIMAKDMAFNLARDWVLNVYQTYENSQPHTMFEKYNVSEPGKSGGGGEYKIQEGFGWTNGVVMMFLNVYGHKIKTQDTYDPAPLVVGTLLMLVSVISVLNYMYRVRCCKRLTWNSVEIRP
ncbi:trehalase-like isoform X2 [Macrobrachium nipponense]